MAKYKTIYGVNDGLTNNPPVTVEKLMVDVRLIEKIEDHLVHLAGSEGDNWFIYHDEHPDHASPEWAWGECFNTFAAAKEHASLIINSRLSEYRRQKKEMAKLRKSDLV